MPVSRDCGGVLCTSRALLQYEGGATQAEHLRELRQIVPEDFLLVPGVKVQGGSLEEVSMARRRSVGYWSIVRDDYLCQWWETVLRVQGPKRDAGRDESMILCSSMQVHKTYL